MRRLDDLDPLPGAQLVGTDPGAHRVVQDLGRGAGKRTEPLVAQAREERRDAHAERARAVRHLERRERMDVHPRHRPLHRAQQRDVSFAGVGGMNAALHADLGRAPRPGFLHPAPDLFEREIIGLAAERFGRLALGERAEPAAERAEVGVVDVPVDDVAHGLTGGRRPDFVRRGESRLERALARAEELHDARFVEPLAPARARKRRVKRTVATGCAPRRRRRRRDAGDAGAPVLGSRVTLAVARRQHLRHERGVQPPGRFPNVGRIDREPLDRHEPGRARGRLERRDRRPGVLGIDVVVRDRRDAAPVVDAGVEQFGEARLAQVRRHLDAGFGAENHPRCGGGPQKVVEGCVLGAAHARVRLRPEVLHDDFLQMAVMLVGVLQRDERRDALEAGLADADQDPRSERHARAPSRIDRFEPHRRQLVGAAVVRAARRAEPIGDRFQHHPLRDAHLPQPARFILRKHARVHVGQQAGLGEHERTHRGEILDRRTVPQPVERLARGRMHRFRPIAQGE